MKYLSGVGMALSLVFGCLFLVLLFEIYYFLWWKNRIIKRSNEDGFYNRPATEFFYKFCCKKPSSSSTTSAQEISFSGTISQTSQAQEIHANSNDYKNLQFNSFGSEDSIPRFLFSIEEETKSDLESENGRSSFGISRKQSRSKSSSDLIHNIAETPFLTPVTSPPYFTPPLTPSSSSDNHNQMGCINPFLESQSDAIFNKLSPPPPPKLKLLRDGEHKLYSSKIMEEEEGLNHICSFEEQYRPSSSSSQVLPMDSSPPNRNSKSNS